MSEIFTLKPLGKFPQLVNTQNYRTYNFYQVLKIEDFERGLNPFEKSVLKSAQLSQDDPINSQFNLFSYFILKVLPHSDDSSRQAIEGRIIEHFCCLIEHGILHKNHALYTIGKLNTRPLFQSLTINLTHALIERNHLTLTDTIKVSGHTLCHGNIEVPLLFGLNSKHAASFFERYDLSDIKALYFDLKNHTINTSSPVTASSTTPKNYSTSTPPHSTTTHSGFAPLIVSNDAIKRYDYLAYAQAHKDKKALKCCDLYLGDEKEKIDKLAIENILQSHATASLNFNQIKTEIKKQNALLHLHITDPRLLKTLQVTLDGKDLLVHAIEARNLPLIEAMIQLPVFQNKKHLNFIKKRNYVSHAAHKKQVSVEQMLVTHNFYDISSFGHQISTKPKPQFGLVDDDVINQSLYLFQTPNLSDSTWTALMKKGMRVDVKDLFIGTHREAYAFYLKKVGDQMVNDTNLIQNLKIAAIHWDSASWAQYTQNAHYALSPNHLHIVLSSAAMLEQSKDHRQLAGTLTQLFFDSLKNISHGPKASWAMNLYLKYFPNDKPKLLNYLSSLTNDWAMRFDKKSLESDLHAFLSKIEDKPQIKKSDTKKYKI